MTDLHTRPTSAVPARSADRSRRMKSNLIGRYAWSTGPHLFLAFWALLVGVPLLWSVVSSLKTDREIFSSPWGLPATLQWDNYARAWTTAEIGSFFFNTVLVAGGALLLTMLLGSMVAYVLARYSFVGNRFIFYLFIAGMMFPIFLAIVPLFFVVDNLGLLNSLLGLTLVMAAYALPFTVFFLTGFFKTLPTAIAEAAWLDGCGHVRVFFYIMLPLARPGIISVGILNFLGLWNQYLLPLVLISDRDKFVLSQGLASLAVTQGYQGDFSALFAGLMIAMLPIAAIYLFFHSRIKTGLNVGALK
jgi:N-acetylglucosamine transport system permease protein